MFSSLQQLGESLRATGYIADSIATTTVYRAIVKHESDWQPCTVSSKGAAGLMQLMPATAHQLGVTDRCDLDQTWRAAFAISLGSSGGFITISGSQLLLTTSANTALSAEVCATEIPTSSRMSQELEQLIFANQIEPEKQEQP